jgi:hypothetical protein
VEVRTSNRTEVMRLLAGVAMNLPFKAFPVDPGVRAEDEALSLYLVPYSGKFSTLLLVVAPRRLLEGTLQIRIEGPRCVEIRLLDRGAAEFFLDEDPMIFQGRLTLQVAGSLAFVPGSEYRVRAGSGALA